MKNPNILLKVTFAATGLLLLATGCASKQPNPALDSARATYERVSQATLVNKYSTDDLNVAKRKLDYAEKAWRDKEDTATIDQHAQIAEKYALIAEQRSQLLQHEDKIDNAKLERTEVQMALRVSEADTAKSEATQLAAQAAALQEEVKSREDKLQQQLAELEELKALQAKDTDRGMVLTLGDVLFDTGESTLRAGAYQNVSRVAQFMQNYPERSLLIEGHTDNTGDYDFNYNLSVERASAVRAALAEQGINGSRIVAKGLGENSPVASNNEASGRQRNRRVDLIFDHVAQTQFQETKVISEIDE